MCLDGYKIMVKTDIKKIRILDLIVWVILILLLAVFIYQLVNRILGHSWQIEALVVALMTLTLTVMFSNGSKISSLEGEFRHFRGSFGALANDFKELRKEFHNFKTAQENFNNWSRTQFNEIKRDIAK